MTRERCRACNARLKAYNKSQPVDTDQTPDPRHEVVKIYRDTHGNQYAYDYRAGFGQFGEGEFCSLRCGYDWAMKVIKDAEEGREEYQRAFD